MKIIAFVLFLGCLPMAITIAAEPTGKKYLIIHGDDAGMSHSVNMATTAAMEKGVVSSASIMVPCPWFKEFAAYARSHPDLDYGIHLTLNSEWDNYRWGPVASRDKVPSLVDEEGYLWDNVPQVAKHASAEEAAIELRAQVDRAKKFGVPLSHLDTHMGAVMSRPDLIKVYIELGLEYDLPVLWLSKLDENQKRAYPSLAPFAHLLTKKLKDQGLPVLDRLYQFYGGKSHEERRAKYVETLQDLEPGINQIIIHCGYADAELRAITNSAERRDGDRQIFMEPEIAEMIKRLGIEIVTWKQVRELQRGM